MLKIVNTSRAFIHVRATDWLSSEDYRRFEPALHESLRLWGRPAPLLLDLMEFRGWTVSGLLKDIRFDLKYRKTFSRIAVVGTKHWHQSLTFIAMPVFGAKMRFFWLTQRQIAEAWLAAGA